MGLNIFFYSLKAQTFEWQFLSSIEYEFYGGHDQGILLEFFIKNVNLRILVLNLEREMLQKTWEAFCPRKADCRL